MTQAIAVQEASPNAWPIDTQARIVAALAGRNGTTARELSAKTGVALAIIVEWLAEKVRQRLLRFDSINGTYRSLCGWPAVPQVVGGSR